MNRILLLWCFLCGSLTLISCGEKEEAGPATSLAIRSITPAAGAVASRSTVIEAQLDYTVANRDTAIGGGYLVEMLLAYTNQAGERIFIRKSGAAVGADQRTVTLSYALEESWDSSWASATPRAPLARPITCYFTLITSKNGIASNIAETKKIVFAE